MPLGSSGPLSLTGRVLGEGAHSEIVYACLVIVSTRFTVFSTERDKGTTNGPWVMGATGYPVKCGRI